MITDPTKYVKSLLIQGRLALCSQCGTPHGGSNLVCTKCRSKNCQKCKLPFRGVKEKICKECLRKRNEK